MRCITLALALVLAAGLGCNKDAQPAPQQAKPAPKPKEDPPANVQKDPPKKQPLGAIARWMEIPEVRNHLKQVGLAYVSYETMYNKGPQKLADLLPVLDKSNRLIEPLKDGTITFIYGVSTRQMPKGPSNTILAYETEADRHSRRVCLMGDGSVQDFVEDEFTKAPKAK
jgi:hypothetical protein